MSHDLVPVSVIKWSTSKLSLTGKLGFAQGKQRKYQVTEYDLQSGYMHFVALRISLALTSSNLHCILG